MKCTLFLNSRKYIILITMQNLFKKLDLFGINLHLIIDQDTTFQSIVGAILSVCVYTLSFVYFVYVMVLWGNGDIIPRLIQNEQIVERNSLTFMKSPIELKFFGDKEPFNIQNNILIPLLVNINSDENLNPTPFFAKEQIKEKTFSKSISPDIQKLKLDTRENIDKPDQNMVLMLLIRCDPKYLPPGGYCAQNEEIDDFLSTPFKRLYLSLSIQQFNQRTQEIETFQKPYYFLFDKNLCLYTQIIFQNHQMLINDGFLLGSLKEKQYFSNSGFITQDVTPQYFRFYTQETYFSAFITLDNKIRIENIAYPQLGEILANVGSIASILLSVKIIASFINGILMDSFLIDKIIRILYPEINLLEIHRNFKGKQFSTIKLGKILTITSKSKMKIQNALFETFYQKAQLEAKAKLKILNQIQSIVKIQIIIQNLQEKMEKYLDIQNIKELNQQNNELDELRFITQFVQNNSKENFDGGISIIENNPEEKNNFQERTLKICPK